MANLKPFRDYDEHDVINLFAVNSESANKGTVVVAEDAGVNFKNNLDLDSLSSYPNTLSAQFNVPWKVAPAASGAAKGSIVGLLLKDVRRYDENGEQLIFNPRKAAEMDVIISGQAVPVLTKGLVLVSGMIGTPGYGSGARPGANGNLQVTGWSASDNSIIGKFLGPAGSDGYALFKLEV